MIKQKSIKEEKILSSLLPTSTDTVDHPHDHGRNCRMFYLYRATIYAIYGQ